MTSAPAGKRLDAAPRFVPELALRPPATVNQR